MKQQKVLHSIKWIVLCKALQAILQFALGMLTARYLGPADHGLIGYAASVTSVAIPVMQLGLNMTLVREYVAHPEQEGNILGTALMMNFVSASGCTALITAFAAVANGGEILTMQVCILYSVSLLFQALELVQHWFQAKLLAKYASLAMLCSYLVVSAYKVYLLLAAKDVRWFALSHAVEYAISGAFLLLAYRKLSTQKLSFSLKTAAALFSKSKHYILAALMTAACGSMAGILMKLLAGQKENGYLSACLTCLAVAQFVYYAIIDSARPVILECKKHDQKQYETQISRLYCVIFYLALAQSVAFAIFARPIIRLLYGAEYLPAVPVLRILVWQIPFAYMGAVRNVWILAEEKHVYLWRIDFWGVLTNAALNLCLIPAWGARGAAAASVLTHIVTDFVIGFAMRAICPNNRLLLAGLHPGFARDTLRAFIKKEDPYGREKDKEK